MSGLLDFARGPALHISMIIFVFGMVWRLSSLFLLPWHRNRATPRAGSPGVAGASIKGVFSHWTPHRTFLRRSLFHFVNGYVFHIGLLVVVFGFGPHIRFFTGLVGLSWPNLPSPVIYAVGSLTLGSLLVALVHRLGNPVQRLISNFDDYFSWFVTVLPLFTGLMAAGHLVPDYESMLAAHILSVCLLLIWFPFGKLMHSVLFIPSRAVSAARLVTRGATF